MTIDKIIERFEQISAVPRGTKREDKISLWLQAWAKDHGFSIRTDQAGNLAIRVPASPGLENNAAIILQGHMDMVCDKTPDSDHDFTRDPIRIIRDGDWLKADRTTLGADNGIAIAMALVLAEDPTVAHPPLDLLFTVQEEIGLVGASGLDPNLITGKTLINLDSEKEGVFIVGCAGGTTTAITLSFQKETVPPGYAAFRLSVSGLQGGHSGTDIHKHRANANKILVRALDQVLQQAPLRLIAMKGGTARNVIARGAEAVFAFPKELAADCQEHFLKFTQEVLREYAKTDAGLTIALVAADIGKDSDAVGAADSAKIIQLLMALPHGVVHMSSSIEGFVETSTNLAVIEIMDDHLHVTTNQRSSVMSRKDEIDRRVEATAQLAGAGVRHSENYPAWQPDMDSALLKRAITTYETLFAQKPEVKTIHAGLECGIISDRCGGLDMISFGPTINYAHSPEERLNVPSIGRVWSLLISLLNTF
jgi:dipeptidase D